MKKNPQIDKLAAQFNVTRRTVTGWRKDGAPLDDLPKLRAWLAARKHFPTETKRTGSRRPSVQTSPPVEATGAASALTRLERAEVAAYGRLQRAIADDDAISIRTSRESWLEIANQLRQYEKAVSADARERGLLVSRVEVENGLRTFSNAIRCTTDGASWHLVQAIKGEPNDVRAMQILRRFTWCNAITAMAAGVVRQIPPWIIEAFSADLKNYLTKGTDEQIQAQAEMFNRLLKDAGEISAKLVIKNTPPAPK